MLKIQTGSITYEDVVHTHGSAGDIYKQLLEHPPHAIVACNFASQVIDPLAEQSDRLAIHCVGQDGHVTKITYKQLVERSYQLSGYFANQGLVKGDCVALMLRQDPAWFYTFVGLIRAGVAVVPFPTLLTSNDLIYRINNLGIRGIVASPVAQDRIDAIRDQCPSLTMAVTTGQACLGWDALSAIFQREAKGPSAMTPSNDPSIYLFTSGTTGNSKAVEHTADYFYTHWVTGRRWMRCTADDVVFNASNPGWGFFAWTSLGAWSMGGKLMIAPSEKKFTAQQMLTILQNQPVTIFCAAPTVLRLLVAHPDFDRFKFPSLKRIVTVGEALDKTVMQRFVQRGIQVAECYGQAETPALIGWVDDQEPVPGAMGGAINPYKVVILDEDFQPLPDGQVGQIGVDLVDGASRGIAKSYFGDLERTKALRSPDSRYHLTGDYAKHSDFFYYQGRRDDLIQSHADRAHLGDDLMQVRQFRIGPDEIEKAGMSHPSVAKIAVIAVPVPIDAQATTSAIKALILLKPGYEGTPDLITAIQEHIRGETASYKCPQTIEFLEQQEWESYETISGKIRRAALRDREQKK